WVEVKPAPEIAFWLDPPPGGDASMLADLFLAVRRATAARPPAFTKEDRLAAGQSLSEIFDGPLLEHGVILDQDLHAPRSWDAVRELAIAALLDFAGGPVKGSLQVATDGSEKNPHVTFVFHLANPASPTPVDPKVLRLIEARGKRDKAAAPQTTRLIRAPGWSRPKPDPNLA